MSWSHRSTANLQWTDEQPIIAGWYWVGIMTDEGPVSFVAEVWEQDGVMVAQIKGGNVLGVDHEFFHYWAGPIPRPEGEFPDSEEFPIPD
jgi:hypothetical protein